MRYALFLSICFVCFNFVCSGVLPAADWLMLPSTYSHSPVTGQRVNQFMPGPKPEAPNPPNFRRSGYTHYRSTLAYGQSADNYHRVDKWGDDVRPYGEWRFPYRPYSTPYQNWGTPFGGLNLGVYPNVGYGYGGGVHPGSPAMGTPGTGPPVGGNHSSGNHSHVRPPTSSAPYPAGGNSPYPVAPYYDGYYPPYRQ